MQIKTAPGTETGAPAGRMTPETGVFSGSAPGQRLIQGGIENLVKTDLCRLTGPAAYLPDVSPRCIGLMTGGTGFWKRTCLRCFLEGQGSSQACRSTELWCPVLIGRQIFLDEMVTAETAHDIGVELARRLWAPDFPVTVTTYEMDGNCCSRFAIGGLSPDGKQFIGSLSWERARMAELSRELCRTWARRMPDGPWPVS